MRGEDVDALKGQRIKLEDGRVALVTSANKRLGKSTTHQLQFEQSGTSEAVLLRKEGKTAGVAFRIMRDGEGSANTR